LERLSVFLHEAEGLLLSITAAIAKPKKSDFVARAKEAMSTVPCEGEAREGCVYNNV
jgi:hypothetical protein